MAVSFKEDSYNKDAFSSAKDEMVFSNIVPSSVTCTDSFAIPVCDAEECYTGSIEKLENQRVQHKLYEEHLEHLVKVKKLSLQSQRLQQQIEIEKTMHELKMKQLLTS